MNNPFGQPAALPAIDPQREAVLFSGRGAEYFGIWIINLVLTVLTPGIYSAWAKEGAAPVVLLPSHDVGRQRPRLSR